MYIKSLSMCTSAACESGVCTYTCTCKYRVYLVYSVTLCPISYFKISTYMHSFIYVCRFYEVAPPDGLLYYILLLTVELQDGRNGSDSVQILVEGMCAIFQNVHCSDTFDANLSKLILMSVAQLYVHPGPDYTCTLHSGHMSHVTYMPCSKAWLIYVHLTTGNGCG